MKFEEIYIGWKSKQPVGRTVTETDEIWLCNLVTSPNQLHFNRDYATRTQFKQSAVNAPVTNALVVGLTMSGFGKYCMVKEWLYIRMPKPLFVGETVYVESEVINLDAGADKDDFGAVTVRSKGITENGKTVIEMEIIVLVPKEKFDNKIEFPITKIVEK